MSLAVWFHFFWPPACGVVAMYIGIRQGERKTSERWRLALADVASRWGRDPLAKAVLDAVEESAMSDRERERRRRYREEVLRDIRP